jgi:hypothetical protein
MPRGDRCCLRRSRRSTDQPGQRGGLAAPHEGLRCRRCRPAVPFGIVVRLPVFLDGGLSGC